MFVDKYFIVFTLLSMSATLGATPSNKPGHQKPTEIGPVYYALPVKNQCCFVIAHAGGAIQGNAYTNSIDAITRNYRMGTRYFEIDFEVTADGHWVAAHDWPHWQQTTAPDLSAPPTISEFQDRPIHRKSVGWSIENHYTPTSLDMLVEFLKAHPDAYIVTDIKKLELYKKFVATILSLEQREQFVFQAYSFEHIALIKSLSSDPKIILTMYRLGKPERFLEQIRAVKHDLFGLTIPMNWLSRKLIGMTSRENIQLYLHGSPANINSRELHFQLGKRGVDGFYLD